jgi:hypothetical protein
MIYFSFKKEAKVYIVYKDNQYNIDVSNITFTQTINNQKYSDKTLQTQNMFKKVTLDKVNPATFELTFPAIREGDLEVLFNRALDYDIFDLYITTKQDVFKVEGCVITNTVFTIEKTRPLSMSISGEGVKLTREGDFGVTIVPGTPFVRSNTRTYNRTKTVDVILGGVAAINAVTAITIELQNQIEWTPYKVIDEPCGIDTLVYPTTFTIKKRILSGTITKYRIDDITWNSNTTLRIIAGERVLGTTYGFDFDIDNVTFTSRIGTGEIFTQSYDWRMTQNPTSLLQVITYVTLPDGVAGAIQDSWDQDILDSLDLPILESV